MDFDKIPSNFQKLTKEDADIYGTPDLVYLSPPAVEDSSCMLKRKNWIEWQASSYPAERHSEYLFRPEIDNDANAPKIMLSAILRTPVNIKDYLSDFKSKRRYDIIGKKALSRGYTAKSIEPAKYSAEIWEIIHSSKERQGREIVSMFGDRPKDFTFPEYRFYTDDRYKDICCGVFTDGGVLVAYLLGKRVGDHVQYDEIMGHKDHVHNDVMYLLHIIFLEICAGLSDSPKCLNYGSWYSGQNPFSPLGGLNRWKRKTHFKPAYLILASS